MNPHAERQVNTMESEVGIQLPGASKVELLAFRVGVATLVCVSLKHVMLCMRRTSLQGVTIEELEPELEPQLV